MYDIILFTGINEGKDAKNVANMPALGAYKCAHVLRENGYSCLVIDYTCYFSAEELINILDIAVGPNTLMVGSSTTFLGPTTLERKNLEYCDFAFEFLPYDKEISKQIVEYLKNKNIKLLVGGSSITENWPNKTIDYVIVGYAEIAIVNLANHLKNKTDIAKSYKNIHGVTIIDDRTASEYDFVNSTMRWLDIDVVNRKKLPIEIGRGCIFKCSFCAYPMNGKKKLDFIKNIDHIIEELEYNYYNYGIKEYAIVDDTFNDSVEKIQQLHDRIIKLPFKLWLWAYIRLDLLTIKTETIDLLYNMGLRACLFGIESFHMPTAKALGKGFNKTRQIETIAYIKNKYPDWKMEGSFIVGAPYESKESIWDTAELIANKEVLLDGWAFTPLSITKVDKPFKSILDKEYEKFGYSILEDSNLQLLIWKNEHMNFYEAVNLTKNIYKHIAEKRKPATGFTEDTKKQLPMVNGNRQQFLSEYKTKLLNLISSRTSMVLLV